MFTIDWMRNWLGYWMTNGMTDRVYDSPETWSASTTKKVKAMNLSQTNLVVSMVEFLYVDSRYCIYGIVFICRYCIYENPLLYLNEIVDFYTRSSDFNICWEIFSFVRLFKQMLGTVF